MSIGGAGGGIPSRPIVGPIAPDLVVEGEQVPEVVAEPVVPTTTVGPELRPSTVTTELVPAIVTVEEL